MEQEMLKRILATVNGIITRLDSMDARLNNIEADLSSVREDLKSVKLRMGNLEQNIFDIKTQQSIDARLLNVIFENSIDLTERITGHDLTLDALQFVLQERKQPSGAAF